MNGRPINPTPNAAPQLPAAPPRMWLFVAALMFIYLLARYGLGLYTDYLWFEHLSLQSVFTTQLFAQLGVGFAIAIPVTAVFVTNALIARWMSIRNTLFFSEEIIISQKIVALGIWAVGLLLAWLIGSAASNNWLIFLRYLNQHSFDLVDPVFSMDVSFYLFSLPVLRFLQSWTLLALFLALIGSLAIYALAQQNALAEGRMPVFLPHIQLHLTILGALILLTFAWGHWLSLFDLMYSRQGVAFGASYTDINVSIPALQTMIVMACISAGVLVLNIFLRRPALTLGAIAVWVLTGTIGTSLAPALVQRYVVVPNELAREDPYIKNNIKFTNIAYGLDNVVETDFNPVQLTEEVGGRNENTLKNIRLWDHRPLRDTYQQLQAIRRYYQFNNVDFDRYMIDGELRQVAISARELDKNELQDTWVTQQLQYTHGYGIVANPVNEVTREGLPNLWVQDFPPTSTVGLEVTRPEIYYGETTNDYIFVHTTEREFSYPSGDKNVYSDYEGTGGVVMDSYFKRVAFATHLSDLNMLLSQEFTRDSRVMLNRSVIKRAAYIAPFLRYDNDPYMVIGDGGRLYWILDAYTTSNRFPYSEPYKDLNYIRNSVKVVIDAYNGNLTFYVVDEKDPLIKSYRDIFPALFTPMSDMPEWTRRHIRYPETIFQIQSQQFLSYHMRDVNVFYNQEDLWEIPDENFNGEKQPLEPYYVVLSLPDGEADEFVLIQPFTPNNKDNLIAWMAARSDGDKYGELKVFRFPKQELIFGPLQIEARIDQETEISAQITLWSQSGSKVIRGNLLVLPIEDALLYIEPLYLRAENGQIPELKRIIVATGDQIAMEETLGQALVSLFTKGQSDSPTRPTTQQTTRPSSPSSINLDTTNIADLAEAAGHHYDAAQTALQAGDWATYGAELEQMEATLSALIRLTRDQPEVEQ